jgi:hypothetical protein
MIMPAQSEIRVKGKNILVPSAEIDGRTVIVTGKWIKIASIRDEELADGEPVGNAKTFVRALQKELRPDVLTFFQRPPDVAPKFNFHFERDNYAAIETGSFEGWWEKLPQEARKNTRRAAKRGVTVKAIPFDDKLARGIHELCNETPVRQGRPFWHFGKNFETVQREHATYPERSEFIGAFFEGKLIGFIKLVYVGRIAAIVHILAANAHYDKRPMNALIAKAVEVCAQKNVGYLIYDKYIYGNKIDCSLVEFKRRNGFEPVYFPRYYIPLTFRGEIYVRLKLYRGVVGILPPPILKFALKVRDWFYERRGKSAATKNIFAGVAQRQSG